MQDLLETWDEIAAYAKVSKRTLYRRKLDFQRKGAIFYKLRVAKNGGKERVVCAFKHDIARCLKNAGEGKAND